MPTKDKPTKNSKQTTHGGNIIATAKKLGCKVTDLIDMSSNLSPFGPATPGLREALISRLDEIGHLPEVGSETLRDLFAGKYNLQPEQVLVGNGTTEFIFASPTALGCKRAVIVNPTYADYHLACEWAALPSKGFTLKLEDNFRFDAARLADTLKGGELVFICNPNNPTSVLTPTRDLRALAERHADTIFLVDESYLPFCREQSLLDFPILPNMLVLSSFSKIYGIAGLRLGFLAASPEITARLQTRRKPWGVNRMAQIAGEFLLEHAEDHVESVRGFIEKHRPTMAAELENLPGFRVIPGAANFILCYLEGNLRAADIRKRLLTHRIMVRNCENFATFDDRYIRMSLKNEKDNTFFLQKLREVLKDG